MARLAITFVPDDCDDHRTTWGTLDLDLDVVNRWLPSIDRTYTLPDAVATADQLSVFAPTDDPIFSTWAQFVADTMRQTYPPAQMHPTRMGRYPTADDIAGTYGAFRLLLSMATEDDVTCVGFTSTGSGYGGRWGGGSAALTELALSPRQRLDDAIASISDLPFGGTDCSLPFTWALEQNREYDTVVVMTDNETWAGDIHPHEALRRYRERTGINARTIVVGMTVNDVSIADPKDPGSLDIAGFDSAVPNLIADFSRGAL
jgi:hypothetical protein